MQETSTKPYLLRALYEWCTDNGYTPHIAVRVDRRTRVPKEFVRDGEIVLNISFEATAQLQMGNDLIEFHARFSGKSYKIEVPVDNVMAIYARENGQGMAFQVDDQPQSHGGELSDAEVDAESPAATADAGERDDAAATTSPDTGDDDKRDGGGDSPKTGRGHLKVVK